MSQRTDEILEQAQARQGLCGRIREMLVDRLDLPFDAGWITDDQPLFGRGLELDSIDALELAIGLEYDFEVSVTDDRLDVFGSVNTIADHIVSEAGVPAEPEHL